MKVTYVDATKLRCKLSEDIDDIDDMSITVKDIEDVEDIPDSPDPQNNGIASLLNEMIVGEWDTIREYNDVIVNVETMGREDIASVIRDIVNEEHKHIGQLQQALATISPNVRSIDDGEEEGAKQMAVVDDDFGFATDLPREDVARNEPTIIGESGNETRMITSADFESHRLSAEDIDDEF